MDSTTISSPDFKEIFRGQNESRGKDIFSNLLDNIILSILSLLHLKDAVRTSLLEKRWKYLWTQLSEFSFEFDLPYPFRKEGQNQMPGTYLFDLVDRLFCEANCIQKLRLASGIPVNVQHAISWISSALKHNIKELDLSLDVKSAFLLPLSFSTSRSLNKLTLEMGRDLFVPNCICFPGLKTLNLSCINFGSEKSAQQLFSGCPILQELSLHNCGGKNIRDISISMPTLKTLKISNDVFYPDDLLNCKVNIDAMNLQSLSCSCYLNVEFAPVNLASIVDAYIDIMDIYSSRPKIAGRARKLLSGL